MHDVGGDKAAAIHEIEWNGKRQVDTAVLVVVLVTGILYINAPVDFPQCIVVTQLYRAVVTPVVPVVLLAGADVKRGVIPQTLVNRDLKTLAAIIVVSGVVMLFVVLFARKTQLLIRVVIGDVVIARGPTVMLVNGVAKAVITGGIVAVAYQTEIRTVLVQRFGV